MEQEICRKVLPKIEYGLYVVTASHGEYTAAGTIVWLSQCSFHPPLLMAGIKIKSNIFEVLKSAGAFAVHMLGASQKDIAASFFQPSVITPDSINGIPCAPGKTGSPILKGLAGFLDCRVRDIIEKGDHAVVVGEVIDAGAQTDEPTLLLRDTEWSYRA
jgi:flavin reductase (DIM6/NTAB) family NADH-FMN oxidoreductase RutF